MCGEKGFGGGCFGCCLGSPPHVRGKEVERTESPLQGGITPACAGKSLTSSLFFRNRQDHPRVCGEKASIANSYVHNQGSPPHVRGKDMAHLFDPALDGITPACAGKSAVSTSLIFLRRDHPRMCGEKLALFYRPFFQQGSPPHVRGKEKRSTAKTPRNRITPACAGKSRLLLRSRPTCWDHPRMCGEKRFSAGFHLFGRGSPPHVRGKGTIGAISRALNGITPACAGKR